MVCVAIVEGFGLSFSRSLVLLPIIGFPFFLFFFNKEDRIKIPKQSLFFLGFFVFSVVSLFFSINVERSIYLIFFDMSLFLLFIYAFNNQANVKKDILLLIFITSIFYIFGSFILLFLFPNSWILEGNRLNLLYKPIYDHKTIGDFLLLGTVAFFYLGFIKKKVVYIPLFFIVFPVFVVSFSRTALVAFIFMIVSLLIYHRKDVSLRSIRAIALHCVFGIAGLLCITANSHDKIVLILQERLKNTFFFLDKPLFSSHDSFIQAAIKGIQQFPLFGVGPGNYELLSGRFTSIYLWSNTSFNYFLDLISERGIIAFIFFLLFLISLFIRMKKNHVYFVLCATLFISFQGFSLYTFYFVMILFFLILGVSLDENTDVLFASKRVILAIGAGGILFVNILSMNTILNNESMYGQAITMFPFANMQYQNAINQDILFGRRENALHLLRQYERYFSGDYQTLEYIADKYAQYPFYDKKKALSYYEKAFTWNSFFGDTYMRIERIYTLKKEVEGSKSAEKFISLTIKKYKSIGWNQGSAGNIFRELVEKKLINLTD